MIIGQGDKLYNIGQIKSIRVYSYDGTDSFLICRASPIDYFRQEVMDNYPYGVGEYDERAYAAIKEKELSNILKGLPGNFRIEETFSLQFLVNFWEPGVFSATLTRPGFEGEKAIFYRYGDYWNGITKYGSFCASCTLDYIEYRIDMSTLVFDQL